MNRERKRLLEALRSSLPMRVRRWPRLPFFRQAAVLLPLRERPKGLSLALLVRSRHLRRHAGQVAFPGGVCEPEDKSPRETAVRETSEELGLPESSLVVVGRLPGIPTITGYQVEPFVGYVVGDAPYYPAEAEVEEVFELPLRKVIGWESPRLDPELLWEGHRIWGVTAWILRTFLRRFRQARSLAEGER